MKHWILFYGVLLGLSTLTSCSLKKSIPDGQYLYTGAKAKIKPINKDISTSDLASEYKTLLKNTKTNKRFLGIRFKLRFYNLFYTKKEKGLVHWLQKNLGEPPVLFEEQLIDQTKQLMENKAFNAGFFNVETSHQLIKKERKKRIKIRYETEVETPYLVTSIDNRVTHALIKQQIDAHWAQSLIKSNEPYNLQALKEERNRINRSLKQEGYYFFRSDFLKFKVDSAKTKQRVEMDLVLKDKIPPKHLKQQRIHQIFVSPDFRNTKQIPKDTSFFEGIHLIAKADLLKPTVLRDAILLEAGQLYDFDKHHETLKHLSFLRNYRFVNIQFKSVPDSDSLLNVFIILTPRKQHVIEGSLGLSLKTGVSIGPEISLRYLNRNVFNGAEQLKLNASGNYNYPLSANVAFFREQKFGVELSKPSLITPFTKERWSKNLISKTIVKSSWTNQKIRLPLEGAQGLLDELKFTELAARLKADSTFSPYISLNNLEFSLAYQWQKERYMQHQFTPINLTFQGVGYEIQELKRLLTLILIEENNNDPDASLLNLEKMLTIKPSYTFLFDSRLRKRKTFHPFYKAKIALIGNQLLDRKQLPANLPSFSNYFFQLEQDFRYYLQLSQRQTIAYRLAFNFSLPLKNKVLLPFLDLYRVGGPNSIRAFQSRQVGPGSVKPSQETYFLTGSGDILLESSLEWRPKISSLLELGLFIDAGNIWLYKGGTTNNELANFRINNFYKQLAIGTGLGFRFNFDVVLVRLDFAFPLTKPWLAEGQRWVGGDINFFNKTWRRENIVLQFNLGYSF
jgi:outer membrane translocation and assembly module TamA